MADLSIDEKELDGGIFLSEQFPGKCLKRWWATHLEMKDRTILFFEFCTDLVTQAGLDSFVHVPVVYEVGPDWVMMDYDVSAVPVSELEPDEITDRILNTLREEARKIQSEDSVLLLNMIEHKSDFIRLSYGTRRIMICGLQE